MPVISESGPVAKSMMINVKQPPPEVLAHLKAASPSLGPAKGDWVTDDGPSIRRMIEFTFNSGGPLPQRKGLYFPTGGYIIEAAAGTDQGLIIPDVNGFTMIGEGCQMNRTSESYGPGTFLIWKPVVNANFTSLLQVKSYGFYMNNITLLGTDSQTVDTNRVKALLELQKGTLGTGKIYCPQLWLQNADYGIYTDRPIGVATGSGEDNVVIGFLHTASLGEVIHSENDQSLNWNIQHLKTFNTTPGSPKLMKFVDGGSLVIGSVDMSANNSTLLEITGGGKNTSLFHLSTVLVEGASNNAKILDIKQNDDFTTGTVTIANGIVTLYNGGADGWPHWAKDGTLTVSGTNYTVDTRDSLTQLTLDNLTVNVGTGGNPPVGDVSFVLEDNSSGTIDVIMDSLHITSDSGTPLAPTISVDRSKSSSGKTNITINHGKNFDELKPGGTPKVTLIGASAASPVIFRAHNIDTSLSSVIDSAASSNWRAYGHNVNTNLLYPEHEVQASPTAWDLDRGYIATFTNNSVETRNYLDFDGTDDFLLGPAASNWGTTTFNFAMSFWVNLDAVTGPAAKVNQAFFSMARTNPVTAGTRVIVGEQDGKITLVFDDEVPTTFRVIQTGTVTTGVWYHVVAVVVDGDQRLYVDGATTGTPLTETVSDALDGNVTIGARSDASLPFNGKLSDIFIWNSGTLTAGNVTDLYAGNPISTAERFRYKLNDGGTSQTAADSGPQADSPATLTNFGASPNWTVKDYRIPVPTNMEAGRVYEAHLTAGAAGDQFFDFPTPYRNHNSQILGLMKVEANNVRVIRFASDGTSMFADGSPGGFNQIITAPDGSVWSLTVANDGVLSTTRVSF